MRPGEVVGQLPVGHHPPVEAGAPELVDETLGRRRLVRVEQEVREQRAREPPVERDGATILDDLQRPEDPELHVTFVALSCAGEQLRRLGAG